MNTLANINSNIFSQALKYKAASKGPASFVGGVPRKIPHVSEGYHVGVIKQVDAKIASNGNSYIQMTVELEELGQSKELKMTLFPNANYNSFYYQNLSILLSDDEKQFDPLEPFDKNLLYGKVIEFEVGHEDDRSSNGQISVIKHIIREIKPTLEALNE
ncbi:hypothetical protein [Turicibacter sanguinis]|uniref:hypothetical protein n=2 Tax=Turicibacter sanguinis TaxID=154288 RepID=UPI00232CAF25|nr:hypothetical protein [Turicibacter sanguinis]MDB8460350.1 hypothetical protein [Turicibacter sanguinis]